MFSAGYAVQSSDRRFGLQCRMLDVEALFEHARDVVQDAFPAGEILDHEAYR